MRNTFVDTLHSLALENRNIILMTGDLGFGVLTNFAKELPGQFINAGVAEQNMTGMACGLALEGKRVFTYSIGNFNTIRCVEQIRNDVCYHNANVTIVCIGGGFCYGPLGISHHATEDLAILRAIPNLTVIAPGDTTETRLAAQAICKHQGPVYLRLGRGGEPKVYDIDPDFEIGKAISIHNDGDVALLTTGGILKNAVEAREILSQKGVTCSLHSFHTLKPFDNDKLLKILSKSKLIVTIEEHIKSGGLGGCAAEIIAESLDSNTKLLRLGLREGFSSEVGSQEYLRGLNGLNPEQIAESIYLKINDIS